MSDTTWFRRVAETIAAHVDELGPDGRPFYAEPPPAETARPSGGPVPPRVRKGWVRRFRSDRSYVDVKR